MIDKNFISLKFFSALIKIFITVAVVILYIHYFLPQSWGFFTVEPRQPLITVYAVHNTIVDKKSFLANNMSYGMGVSRKGKILFDQLFRLLNTNKNLVWKTFNEDSLFYITQNEPYTVVSTGNKNSAYRGKFLFTKTDRPSDTVLRNRQKFVQAKQYILADIR